PDPDERRPRLRTPAEPVELEIQRVRDYRNAGAVALHGPRQVRGGGGHGRRTPEQPPNPARPARRELRQAAPVQREHVRPAGNGEQGADRLGPREGGTAEEIDLRDAVAIPFAPDGPEHVGEPDDAPALGRGRPDGPARGGQEAAQVLADRVEAGNARVE